MFKIENSTMRVVDDDRLVLHQAEYSAASMALAPGQLYENKERQSRNVDDCARNKESPTDNKIERPA